MGIVREDGEGNFEDAGDDVLDVFIEHLESLGRFLTSHYPSLASRTVSIDVMVPYDARHVRYEAGGVADYIDPGDWPLLLPLRDVTERQITLN